MPGTGQQTWSAIHQRLTSSLVGGRARYNKYGLLEGPTTSVVSAIRLMARGPRSRGIEGTMPHLGTTRRQACRRVSPRLAIRGFTSRHECPSLPVDDATPLSRHAGFDLPSQAVLLSRAIESRFPRLGTTRRQVLPFVFWMDSSNAIRAVKNKKPTYTLSITIWQ